MKQESKDRPQENDHDKTELRKPGKHAIPPLPTVGAPLDGRQYQNIVDEQIYSEQRPTASEQQPRRPVPNDKS